ncbi:hypothetical protein [Pseudomonas sp. PNPG3]|nr:hypothetical protein [Pseudomonas sp. PNPG3]
MFHQLELAQARVVELERELSQRWWLRLGVFCLAWASRKSTKSPL